jgi:hypothetical protein
MSAFKMMGQDADMLEVFAAALAILTLAVIIIRRAVRNDDVLHGRFLERPDRDPR